MIIVYAYGTLHLPAIRVAMPTIEDAKAQARSYIADLGYDRSAVLYAGSTIHSYSRKA